MSQPPAPLSNNDSLLTMIRDRFSIIEMGQQNIMAKLDRWEDALAQTCNRVAVNETEISTMKEKTRKTSAITATITSTVIGAVISAINQLLNRP